jgi:hypothetical protein
MEVYQMTSSIGFPFFKFPVGKKKLSSTKWKKKQSIGLKVVLPVAHRKNAK